MGNPETAVYKFVINPIGTGAGLKEFFEAAKGEKNAKVETVTWYSQLFKIEQLHMFLAFFDMKYLKTITFKMFVPQVKWLMESDELKDVKKCLIGYVMKPGIECKLHINLESWDFLTQLIETFTEIDLQIGANFDMFFALDYRFDDKGFDEILKQNSSFISSDTDSVDRKIYWFEAKRLRYQLIVMSGSDRLKGQIVSGGFAKHRFRIM
uniref:FTH domain-containing protein n=1 Tax=Caenorhabditis tropicalis TaxID=1561998 RepID=A0A1I7T937_9PELO